jgi:hypothetical protein
MLRRLPSLKTWYRSGEHRPAHRVGHLGSDVPTAALAAEAGEQLPKGMACRCMPAGPCEGG